MPKETPEQTPPEQEEEKVQPTKSEEATPPKKSRTKVILIGIAAIIVIVGAIYLFQGIGEQGQGKLGSDILIKQATTDDTKTKDKTDKKISDERLLDEKALSETDDAARIIQPTDTATDERTDDAARILPSTDTTEKVKRVKPIEKRTPIAPAEPEPSTPPTEYNSAEDETSGWGGMGSSTLTDLATFNTAALTSILADEDIEAVGIYNTISYNDLLVYDRGALSTSIDATSVTLSYYYHDDPTTTDTIQIYFCSHIDPTISAGYCQSLNKSNNLPKDTWITETIYLALPVDRYYGLMLTAQSDANDAVFLDNIILNTEPITYIHIDADDEGYGWATIGSTLSDLATFNTAAGTSLSTADGTEAVGAYSTISAGDLIIHDHGFATSINVPTITLSYYYHDDPTTTGTMHLQFCESNTSVISTGTCYMLNGGVNVSEGTWVTETITLAAGNPINRYHGLQLVTTQSNTNDSVFLDYIELGTQ